MSLCILLEIHFPCGVLDEVIALLVCVVYYNVWLFGWWPVWQALLMVAKPVCLNGTLPASVTQIS